MLEMHFHNSSRLDLVLCLVAQSCPTLCHPMDCSPLGSSVRGIPQARILAWVARGSSWPRGQTCISWEAHRQTGEGTQRPSQCEQLGDLGEVLLHLFSKFTVFQNWKKFTTCLLCVFPSVKRERCPGTRTRTPSRSSCRTAPTAWWGRSSSCSP